VLSTRIFTIACASRKEESGPAVVPPTHTRFGYTVIKDMMAKGHNAEVSVDFAPDGLAWEMDMEAQRIIRNLPAPREGNADYD
jgi:hypothetical protein